MRLRSGRHVVASTPAPVCLTCGQTPAIQCRMCKKMHMCYTCYRRSLFGPTTLHRSACPQCACTKDWVEHPRQNTELVTLTFQPLPRTQWRALRFILRKPIPWKEKRPLLMQTLRTFLFPRGVPNRAWMWEGTHPLLSVSQARKLVNKNRPDEAFCRYVASLCISPWDVLNWHKVGACTDLYTHLHWAVQNMCRALKYDLEQREIPQMLEDVEIYFE